MNDTALLIIDAQVGITEDTEYPLYDGDAVVGRLAGIIERARAASIPVIYVQHHSTNEKHPLHKSKPEWAVDPRIAPQPDDLRVDKMHPDSFQDTTLQSLLEQQGIKNLIIGGMETQMCVDTTTRRAYSLGYNVTLIADGHSGQLTGTITGDQMIQHHNETLANFFADVKPASEIEFAVKA